MIRRVASTLVSRILFVPPKMRLTDRRPNTALWLPVSGHIRLRPLLILLLPLALLMSGTARSQSTVSMFTNVVPTAPVDKTTKPTTLGVKFWSSQAGSIAAILFYRAAKSPSGYVATLYSSNGSTVLGSVTMATESGPVPGWQQAVFAAPISINANTTYVAAYYAPSGQYADTSSGLTNTVTSGTLNAPAASTVGGNGVDCRGKCFPNSTGSDNFFVDVAFTSSAPVLNIALNPTNPTIPSTAPLGTVVATVSVTWSNGAPFTGTLSFGPPNSNGGGVYALSGNNLIINPAGPGVGAAGGSVQNVTIVATQ
jgi:hypothetical protein